MMKEAALEDFVKRYVLDRWQQELSVIDKRYYENKHNIKENLLGAFDSLCKNAVTLQELEKKGPIKYIYFSFLRTSIMQNTSLYRLDAYDEKWFLDKEECTASFEVDFIFNSLFQHMEELENKKMEYGRQITSMDIERIKLLEAPKYHIMTVEFIRSLVQHLVEIESYKKMLKSKDICIMAGEYMDASEILYKENGVKE